MAEPTLKKGWLKKLSRSGLVKNWQKRFFVLSKGRIYYYTKSTESFPYGEDLKGDLHLLDATVTDDRKKCGERQFYVSSGNGQKDMLMEAATENEANEWMQAIRLHIAFAPKSLDRDSVMGVPSPSFSSVPSISAPGSNGTQLSKEPSNTGSGSGSAPGSHVGSEDVDLGPRGSDERAATSGGDVVVVPKPGWVIKVFRTAGEKLFINLCEHSEVPNVPLVLSLGYNKWPFMVLTPARVIPDGGGDVTVYDAVVNPAVVVQCNKDNTAKDATCARVMRLLKKQYGEDLQPEFKLPKITKRYKGEIVAVHLPATVQNMARSRSSVLVPARGITRSNSLTPQTPTATELAGEEEDGNDALSKRAFQRSASSTGSAVTVAGQPGGVSPVTRPSVQPTQRPSDPGSAASKGNGASSLPASNTSNAGIGPGTGMERRTTISRLFLKMEDGNSAAADESKFSRIHTEVPFAVAQDARSGTGNKAAVRSMINPMPDKPVFVERKNDPSYAMLASNSVSVLRKYVIPYQIVRPNGTIAKTHPEKSAPGKILGHGVKVFVIARRPMDTAIWFATTEGWIASGSGTVGASGVGGGGPVLIPTLHGQPTHMKICSTRFEDISQGGGHPRMSLVAAPRESGWFIFRSTTVAARTSLVSNVPFQTRFVMEVFHIDNAVVRLSRTFSEVLDLRDALMNSPLKVVKDRAMKAGSLPYEEDGLQDYIDDVNALLALVEGVEAWLNKILQLQVSLNKCKPLADFLQPRERLDYDLMENELMARDGLSGAWAEELEKGF